MTLAGTLTALALNAVAIPAHATTIKAAASASTVAPSPALLTADQASAKAKSTKKAVAVDAATTATDQLTANPDGSFTLNRALAPVRKRVDGAWKALDATLVKRADGSIGPAVSASDLALSGGGNSPLAVMKVGPRSLALTLPSTLTTNLPAPTLAGPTATYALLKGVDLQVTADTQGGFSEVLIVKDATAAANPALASLAFTTKTAGVDLATDAAGNITAKDPHGTVVFSAPAPTSGVWDSATDPAAPTVTDPTTGATLDARSGTPTFSSKTGPGAAAHTAPLKAAYGAGKITLTPDPALLSGKNTVWPLYIDPTYSAGGGTALDWTYVNSAYSGTSYWHTSDTEGLRVGDQAWQSPYFVGRAFARMSIDSRIYGATVINSRFYATETWSPSCNARNVELWWTDAISASTTWNNQPSWKSRSDTQSAAHGYSSSCPTASVGFDTTGLMQTAANGSWSDVTLGLRASDESDAYGWKKFQPSTMYMSTTYDHAPNTPNPLTTSPSTACAAAAPTIVGNGDVTLYAGVSDPDGGSLGVAFNVVNTTNNAVIASSSTSTLSATSGTTASLFIPRTTLVNASAGALTTFAWNVYTSDGTFNSPTSATCRFTFDASHPGAPTITQNATSYTVGTAAGFTLTPNATGATPASYLYQLNGAAPGTIPTSSGSASVTIAPTCRVNTLTVTAISPGGNIGDTANVILNAAAPATAVENDFTGAGHADLVTVGGQAGLPPGLWLASGSTASTLNTAANDIGANGNGVNTNGTATDWNGTQAIVGHFANGAGFNDILDYNPANGRGQILYGNGDGSPLLPYAGNETNVTSTRFQSPNTQAYATHIANGGGLYNTVNGATVTGFPDLLLTLDGSLYLEPALATPGGYAGITNALDLTDTNPTGSGTWAGWTIASTLVGGLPALYARADTTGQLYYYSPTALQSLALGTTVTPVQLASTGWDATNKPVLTAADINGDGIPDLWTVGGTGVATANFFNGTSITGQAPQTLVAPTHTWALKDSSTESAVVASAVDSTGSLNLTGQSGATWSTKDLFAPDVQLNGTTSGVMTSPAALSPSASFTVSVWAKPTATGGVILSQDGTQSAGFLLYPDIATNVWEFCLSKADSSAWSYDCASGGTGTVHLNAWTHLTATYSASSNQMALYVNGIDVAAATHTPVAGFTGKFTVGDYMYQGSPTAPYSGALSNLQVWAGTALTPSQAASLSGTPGYVLFPSDGTNYASGTTWTTAHSKMTFNAGVLSIAPTGSATAAWTQGTAGTANAVLTLQPDGNLVIYPQAAHTTGTATWAAGLAMTNDVMFFQPDGNLVIYRSDGMPAWASGTYGSPGTESEQTRSAGTTGAWSAPAQATTIPGATAVTAAGMPNGDTVYITLAGGQEYAQWHHADGTWTNASLINTTSSAGVHYTNITAVAAAADGTGVLQILSLTGGTLQHQTWSATTGWSWLNPPPGGATNVTAISAAGLNDGSAQFMSVVGGVEYHQIRFADGTWAGFNQLGNSGVTAVAAAALPDGSTQFMSVIGGVEYHQIRNANGTWSGLGTLGNSGVTAVAATGDADGTTQFISLSGTTAYWQMRNNNGTWTNYTQQNTAVSAATIAGYPTATTSNTWYNTTHVMTIN